MREIPASQLREGILRMLSDKSKLRTLLLSDDLDIRHKLQNSYDQNGEKSSVKCEICTKLDRDPPCDLFDFIFRKAHRLEHFQELADA